MHALCIVMSAAFLIVVSILVLVVQFWFLGVGIIAVGLWQILFVCQLGMAYESICEELADQFYFLDWYLLTPRQRKQWLLIMHMTQRPYLNTMGHIWPCNLNSFIRVLRNIYSFLMMLLSVGK